MKLVVALALAAACSSNKPLVGNRCDADTDCANTCVNGLDAWPQGFCTFICIADAECGSGELCVIIANGGDGKVCGLTCGSDADCEHLGSGYSCKQAQRAAAVGSVGICFGG